MVNPRKKAVDILLKINKNGSYSNLTINNFLNNFELSFEDKSFITALVYGTLEREITLDYVLNTFIKTSLKKVSPFTLSVLRISLYQIMFMDKVPASAAVNEAVKLVKNSKESRNAGFVNAVLRNVLRSDKLLPEGDTVYELSIRYSCPQRIIESFISDYGINDTLELLSESLKPVSITVKVNTLKTDVEDFERKIASETERTDIPNALILKKGINISENKLFKNGEFYVQDIAAQKVVEILSPKSGDRMLDMCAAPGGKSFAAAILMKNIGEIISCDIYEHKCGLIKSSAERLGIKIIKPMLCDATEFNDSLGLFDCILCDVPCSGLGIIRRKPEIKYKDFSEFEHLPNIQYKILQNAVKYLKPKGRIMYSTCTLRKAENEFVTEKFLLNNKDFSLVYKHTFLPHIDKTDGFFCALFERN